MVDELVAQGIRYRDHLEESFSRAYRACRRMWENDVVEGMGVSGWPFLSRLVEQTEADPEHGWVLTPIGQRLVRTALLSDTGPDQIQYGRITFRRAGNGVELVWDRPIVGRVARAYRRLIEFDMKGDYRHTMSEEEDVCE